MGILTEALSKGFTISDKKTLERYFLLCEIQKWLIEKHNLCVSVWYDDGWVVEVINIIDSENVYDDIKTYSTYEEAFEFGLYEGLKLIGNGKKEEDK